MDGTSISSNTSVSLEQINEHQQNKKLTSSELKDGHF